MVTGQYAGSGIAAGVQLALAGARQARTDATGNPPPASNAFRYTAPARSSVSDTVRVGRDAIDRSASVATDAGVAPLERASATNDHGFGFGLGFGFGRGFGEGFATGFGFVVGFTVGPVATAGAVVLAVGGSGADGAVVVSVGGDVEKTGGASVLVPTVEPAPPQPTSAHAAAANVTATPILRSSIRPGRAFRTIDPPGPRRVPAGHLPYTTVGATRRANNGTLVPVPLSSALWGLD